MEGGVAGAQPLHKGGRLRPTAHMTIMRREGTSLLPPYRFAIQLRLCGSVFGDAAFSRFRIVAED